MPTLLTLMPLLGPLGLVLACLVSSRLPRHALASAGIAAGAALALALASAAATAIQGASSSQLLGAGGLGVALRLDALSTTLFLLTAFLGLVVIRFSRNYLAGDPRQARFVGLLCLTLAAVMMLVLAGNLLQLVLAWIGMSLALHRLLVFYPERPAARLAARKKAIVARTGDAALLLAATILFAAAGTGDIAAILDGAAGGAAPWAAWLVVLAACLKSAQFPLHGWLPEVMETPTPVSALLHAGIVNAGGFLVLRFADLVVTAPEAMLLMAAIGAATALVGAAVMLTQSSAKVSLAWSTVAQMGFMMLQLGLGAFALALLHLVGHSLYKAHAFLSAGGAVEAVVAKRPATVPGLATAVAALALALGAAALAGLAVGAAPVALAFGAILALGLAPVVAAALAERRALETAASVGVAAAVALLYVALSGLFALATSGALPAAAPPGGAGSVLIVGIVAGFAGLALLGMTLPRWRDRPLARRVRVHLANGLYANALFDRFAGRLARTAP
jgi:NAD(P)H-quinone oxidoreductase subunit 5